MAKYQTLKQWSADHLVSAATARDLIKRGMPALRVGNQYRLDPAATDQWLHLASDKGKPLRLDREAPKMTEPTP